jgi:ATP-dependent phosphofructokinase / diphosphate-dependent phosphofructokinase
MSNNNTGKKLGIICGGGPAPGINTVISSVAIAALKRGFDEVIGFNQGFKWLSEGDANHWESLTISKMTKIFNKGGVYLVTSRANPCGDDRKLDNCVRVFKQLGITHLVTIGGEDTAFSSMTVADHARKQGYEVHTVHVPKTIDNDLPLPEGVPTFGFETARAMGTTDCNGNPGRCPQYQSLVCRGLYGKKIGISDTWYRQEFCCNREPDTRRV